MWICPKCSEPHDDQFEHCWKCIGDELQTAITASPPLPSASAGERTLRPFREIVARALIGFLIGFVLTMAFITTFNSTYLHFLLGEGTLVTVTLAGLAGGAVLGLLVGIFFWVAFPYAPLPPGQKTVENPLEARQYKD